VGRSAQLPRKPAFPPDFALGTLGLFGKVDWFTVTGNDDCSAVTQTVASSAVPENSVPAVFRTGRRRTCKLGADLQRTGDIAHLEARGSISLFVRYVKKIRFLFAISIPFA
jgi:hypothetical protein